MNATVICLTEQYAEATSSLLLLHQILVGIRDMETANAVSLGLQQ